MSIDDIGPDKDHPTDDGYKMFAGVWWDAISKIEDQIQAPAKVDNIDDAAGGSSNQCKKVAGNAGLPGQSQMGSGHDDGNYVHKSTSKGVIESAKIDKGSDPKSITDAIPWHIFFANIVKGDPNAERTASLDDWIRVYHNTKNKNAYWFRQNLGGGKFDKSVQFNVDMDCDLGPREYSQIPSLWALLIVITSGYDFADFVSASQQYPTSHRTDSLARTMMASMTSSVSRRTLYGSRSTEVETLPSSRASAKLLVVLTA